MIYLFEDKREDKLSQLYLNSLPDNIKKNVQYAQGNGCLLNKAKELLLTGEKVIVFLDTVPENKYIRDIYINLSKLSRENDYRLIVWNIVCAEFYFIKAYAQRNDLQAFIHKDDLDIVLLKKPYKEAKIIANNDNIIFKKSFEKFCKLFVLKNGGACVKENGLFFKDDCNDNLECSKLSLQEKSLEYRSAYEFLLRFDYTDDELWVIHRSLIDAANAMIKTFNEAGPEYKVIRKYEYIK